MSIPEVNNKKLQARIEQFEARRLPKKDFIKQPLSEVGKFEEREKYRAYWKSFISQVTGLKIEPEACIYGLLDPCTKDIFYIGATKNKKQRRKQHKNASANADEQPALKEKLVNIKNKGTTPLFVTLEKLNDLTMKWRREKVWIEFFEKQNVDLLNVKSKRFGRRGPYRRRQKL